MTAANSPRNSSEHQRDERDERVTDPAPSSPRRALPTGHEAQGGRADGGRADGGRAGSNAAPHDSAGHETVGNGSAGSGSTNMSDSAPAAHAAAAGNGVGTTELAPDAQKRALMEHLMTQLARDTAPVEDRERLAGSFRVTNYTSVLRRRWLPMLLVFLVALPLVAWRMRPGATRYIATARMLLPSGAPAGVEAGGGSSGSAEGKGVDLGALSGFKSSSASKVDTQIAIVQSPMMIERALRLLPASLRQSGWGSEEVSSALGAAVGMVTATSTVSPDLIDIAVNAAAPDAAVALANATVRAYGDYIKEFSRRSNDVGLRFVARQRRDAERQLLAAKRDLQRFKERNNVFDLAQALEAGTLRIAALEEKAGDARTEANAGTAGEALQKDDSANSLQRKVAEARLNYEAKRREYLDSAPETRRAAQQLADVQQQANARLSALMGAAQQRARSAEQALAQARARAAALPAIELKLSELLDRVQSQQAAYKALTDRYTALRISSSAQTPAPTALTPATDASTLVPTWARALLLGTLAALTLAALLAALLEQLDTTLHTTEDLEPLLRTPLLGTMPLLRGRTERRLSHLANPSIEAPVLLEACRILRSNLTFASVDAPLRSVLVTSADPGEGKSLSALNLATVMAMDGRRVILLDCDLRRPMQHMLNEVPLEPGFTNILTNEATLEEALRPTALDNLWLLPAGTLPPNPPELLGSEHGRQLLRDLKERCDLVVIDSPPVLSLSDPQVLCSSVDGVVLIAAANSTPRQHLQRAQATLRHAGGRLLGVLFNKVREGSGAHALNNYYTYAPVGNGKALDGQGKGVSGLLKRR